MTITQEMWNAAEMHARLVSNYRYNHDDAAYWLEAQELVNRFNKGERSVELYNAMKGLWW